MTWAGLGFSFFFLLFKCFWVPHVGVDVVVVVLLFLSRRVVLSCGKSESMEPLADRMS